ncbi:MAG: GTP pyrophosphokinase family protein [Faecalicoccus sp.]|nr:GTP pyrophosphokinase family protein [Faecalicoccus sp.]
MDSIYGNHLEQMNEVMNKLIHRIEKGIEIITNQTGMDPVEHLKSRIKDEQSMREKCRRKDLPETEDSALHVLHDAIGIRVVCSFLDDVYAIRDYIVSQKDIEIIEEKDYIRNVKPTGYRSLHMIVKIDGYFAEIQIRTISMDTWAALEHHMRYKKNIGGNSELIFKELKRCADELASTDASMQTIRRLIQEG